MPHALDTPGLHALHLAGQCVVLPHAHAARFLRARLTAFPSPLDPEAPEPGKLLSWQEWTASLWARLLLDGGDDRVLLNRLQEEQLWADILGAQSPAANSSSLRELAALARSGLQRAVSYRVLHRLHAEADTTDSISFAAASDLFRTHCARHRLLPSALLEEALAAQLGSGTLSVPESVHLVGFEQETPAQQHLLAALEKSGTALSRHSVQVVQIATGRRISCVLPDRAAELRFAVRAVAQHARGRGETSPSIALVCLKGGGDRPELERLFRDLLAPELESVYADLSSAPWHFATPPKLCSAPIIAAALDVLRWTVGPLGLERIGQLLLSPFFAHTDAFEVRARFDIHTLRRAAILRPALDLASFLPLVRHGSPTSSEKRIELPEFRALLRTAEDADLARARRSHAQWAEVVRQLLVAAGWPGSRPFSPIEFRAVEAWEGLLDLLSTLQYEGQRLPFFAFLELLTAEAGELSTQAANPGAPVQVLALEETEGLALDLSIVLDATDQHLPFVQQRHPLLSQVLQRSLGIGDPAVSHARTRTALESLAQRSTHTFLLAPGIEDDSSAQLTPFAAQLAFAPIDPCSLLPGETPWTPSLIEAVSEVDSLPVLHDVEVKGGADVLRLQAACGFRAFASLRLAAGEPQARDLGLNALDTGRILHTALEFFWAGVETQSALRALSFGARRDLVSKAVGAAVARLRPYPQANDSWSAHFLRVLQERYVSLLLRWLDFELQRSPFTVLAQEQQQTLTLGPIRLKLRPDRIDQVEGGLVFVDYKSTYDLSVDHWTDTRPEAPQLPAYALSADPEQLRGITFAQIRPDRKKFGWISLSEQPGIFPRTRNKQVDMRDQMESWRNDLTALAENFAAGDTRVNPKSYPQTCTYCAHRALCRLDPTTLLEKTELDEELTGEEESRG